MQGFLTLPDGRCVVSVEHLPLVREPHGGVVEISKDFRLICLANPGGM
jgi:hypothetical protein